MPYICFIVIAAASWRLSVDHRWDVWWIGFLTSLTVGACVELLDRRRDRARREAAYQKRKAQRDA